MVAHGLDGWAFRFNRCKQAMGLCVYHRRTIELSMHLRIGPRLQACEAPAERTRRLRAFRKRPKQR